MNEWHTQSAQITGRGHCRDNLPCQDRTFTMEKNGVTVIALADGAGSQSLSQEGAACAVETICTLFCEQFYLLWSTETPFHMKSIILGYVQEALKERAAQMNVSSRALSCTLMAVAVRGNDYLLFHVGDGVIGYRKEGKLLVASYPRNGEYVNTTVFVTSSQAIRYAQVQKGTQEALEGFILMSDGSERSLYNRRKQRIAPLTEKLMQRTELLEPSSADILLQEVLQKGISRITTDDCSLALMTRRKGDLGAWERMTPLKQAYILDIRTNRKSKRRRAIRKYAVKYGIRTAV